MKKFEVLSRLVESGVVAVIRADSVEKAVRLGKAAAEGGIVGLEITFTVPGAEEVIETLNKEKDAPYIVGAGTVLDAPTARTAILKGAHFIVSPSFDKEVAETCNLYQVPYFPGCMTPREVVDALKAGADIIKIFPGSAVGPSYFKALHGPFPQANLLPSGGVDLDNVKDWIKNGAIAVSAGSSLTAPAKTGDYEKVTEIARQFVEEVKKARA
ncbi:MAG: bifunctional 2-keto-4-hydroxyglutarate aldolase/2-keto-3-deoxy-6-phosphogluconate aldolase [Eubacteriales bacterium]|nr:bifunctional 2-keto-4-hydroxyglutarate aldolase/2-keto-3-deoxy-6-phosphogluconate aldolase [Eubacteriales bacterium]